MSPFLTEDRNRTITLLFVLFLIEAAWMLPISQARHHWGDVSYYNFGWAVPFLFLYLAYQRLSTCAIIPRLPSGNEIAIATLMMIGLVPFHALSEVNAFWRVPLWAQAVTLTAYSILITRAMLGKAAMRRILFPLLLLTTMIPWPYRMESNLIQGLTSIVSSFSVDILLFLGFPFELAGNSLTMGDRQVGINEACSGIRSLQALFMVTVFCSGVMGISVRGKIIALLILPIVVIAANSVRAVFLSLQVVVHGDAAYNRWHDPAGLIAFASSMLALLGTLLLIDKWFPATQRIAQKNTLPNKQAWPAPISNIILHRRALVLILLPLATYTSVEGWFRLHESEHAALPKLEFNPARLSRLEFAQFPIHPQIANVLGYSYGKRFLVQEKSLGQCEVYFYGYRSDNKVSSVSSYGHSPLICMEAIGATVVGQFPPLHISIPAGNNEITNDKAERSEIMLFLSHAQFEDPRGRKLHVFWRTLEANNKGFSPESLSSLNYGTQLKMLLAGRRDYSRQVLLLSITGNQSAQEARNFAKTVLEEALQVNPEEGAHAEGVAGVLPY